MKSNCVFQKQARDNFVFKKVKNSSKFANDGFNEELVIIFNMSHDALHQEDLAMVRERLINGNLIAIVDQLQKFEFGEHNILTYHDYDSLRELYARHCKQRLEKDNEIVMLLPHYLTPTSIRFALQELDIDVRRHEDDQTLIIMDAVNAIFNPTAKDFLSYLSGLENRAKTKKKDGICILADMGAFYHMRQASDLIDYETSIPIKTGLKSTLLCLYHQQDFERLAKNEQDVICESHFRELMLQQDR